ncbi:hypothetical protein DFH06DRAFT_1205638 [Mycena polygramma]|nr:hypothetical protein DFH06DRAFT_1205638 [Mycena polygramma]
MHHLLNRLFKGVFARQRPLSKQELDSLHPPRSFLPRRQSCGSGRRHDTSCIPGDTRSEVLCPGGAAELGETSPATIPSRGVLFSGYPTARQTPNISSTRYLTQTHLTHSSRSLCVEAITAIFRVNLDYQVPSLSRKALALLSSVYPTTLADFTSAGLSPSYCRDQIMPVIQFARAHSIDWFLPLALYRYCLEGTPRDLAKGIEYGGMRVILSREDEGLCAGARASLVATATDAFEQRFVNRGGECAGGADCRNSRIDEGAVLHARLLRLRFMPRLDFVWTPQPGSKLCGSCLEDMHRWHVQQCESVWDSLPGLFDLPDWNTLNKMKDAALPEADEDDETY